MTNIAERLRDAQSWFDSDDQIAFIVRDAADEIAALKAERDEADRRAGAAERKLAQESAANRKRQAWIDQAKAEAGYGGNTSFDEVWGNLRADRARLAEHNTALMLRVAALETVLRDIGVIADIGFESFRIAPFRTICDRVDGILPGDNANPGPADNTP